VAVMAWRDRLALAWRLSVSLKLDTIFVGRL
jgi:hypothetical protein